MKLFLLWALVALACAASTCGGNCPSGKCPTCLCGTAKTPVDLATWCAKHSWNVNCCKCIATHESGGDSSALNYNTNNTYDVGLWQINQVNWPGCNSGHPPCDPAQNLNCAIHLYQNSGNTWKAWSTTAKGCGC